MADDGAVAEQAPPAGPPEKSKPSGARALIEWVAILLGAVLVAFLVKTFLLQAFYIPSASMEPTLRTDDRVLVNKLSYDFHDLHRGDIVVFKSPPGETNATIKDLIKRVVALPGETVEARDGHVLVDGKPIDESYLPKGVTTSQFEPRKIPPGDIWVMGDNRSNSKDSRYFGPVSESLIVGRAFIRVWPLSTLGFL
ncbi:MAG TPA: signal peptidase I [Acidimicrobiales bacterium]|nr:signal peptidase I [Acidimicrobiales bacterium]